MSYFIIDQIRQAPPQERTELAQRLLRTFQGTHFIPRGYYPLESFDEEAITRMLDAQQPFYTKLEELVEHPPKIFFDIKARFDKASTQMRRVASMSEKQRWRVPLTQWPEYAYDFQQAVQRQFYDSHDCISPLAKRMRFTKKRLGKGGFAEVYRGTDGKKEYAVRIAHPPGKWNSYYAREREKLVGEIRENLYAKKELFQARPFVVLEEVAPSRYNEAICIMELFRGKSVESQIEALQEDEETRTRLLRTYAEMLAYLHKKQLLFVDNCWANMLYSATDAAVCDYDFVSSIPELEKGRFEGVFTKRVASQEQLLHKEFSPSSDVESFALMIDQIYNGDTLREEKTPIEFYKIIARLNKHRYPRERKRKIPKKLRDLITPVISYPKDRSITIDDFLRVL